MPTVTRMPRMQGFPPITAGSRLMRVKRGMMNGSPGPSSIVRQDRCSAKLSAAELTESISGAVASARSLECSLHLQRDMSCAATETERSSELRRHRRDEQGIPD